ncbi:MAG: sigma-70 family RNA polymerase sigma factor [Acidobacteriota bacterium]|jgi:RNA polymerase sigma-70 factor (ECF subfamily)
MNETQAIRLCLRHRDPVGFEYLVTKYRREAYCHAYALMGNGEDAADACQESFQRAFLAIPKLVSLDCFYPWFYRILRNCCLNMLSRRRTILNHARETGSDTQGRGSFDGPSSILAKKEEAQTVWRVLSNLDMQTREILSLKYIQGKSYEEIARVLDIPRGTVMSRLFHARKAFREKYLHISSPECSRANGGRYE